MIKWIPNRKNSVWQFCQLSGYWNEGGVPGRETSIFRWSHGYKYRVSLNIKAQAFRAMDSDQSYVYVLFRD